MPVLRRSHEPYWQTTDKRTVKIYSGDVLENLRKMRTGSAHMAVTSPPYWGLRDYKSEGQIGQERTPEEFIEKLTAVFMELHRVLRDDGTFWLNIGDTYASSGKGAGPGSSKQASNRGSSFEGGNKIGFEPGLPSKNLVGIPWRVALSLQKAGWILRSDLIWAKPSPMPESVTDRCTRSHEYLFMFAKKERYFYDQDAIREKTGSEADPVEYRKGHTSRHSHKDDLGKGMMQYDSEFQAGKTHPNGKNKRTVWTIASEAYPGTHFSTFPTKLVEPCILAGTSEYGCCSICGAPWKRITEKVQIKRDRPNDYVKRTGEEGTGNSCSNSVAGVEVKTVGWEPTCNCGCIDDELPKVVPCTVLDPFIGSGTTAEVALKHNRRCIGIELNAETIRDCTIPRIEGALLDKPSTARLIPRMVK